VPHHGRNAKTALFKMHAELDVDVASAIEPLKKTHPNRILRVEIHWPPTPSDNR
jgi:hypothetical protein